MRPNLFRQTQKLLFPCTALIVALFLLTLASCSGKKAKGPTCVKLTIDQIKKWEKKKFLDPKDSNYISSVEIKTAYAFPGTVFRVFILGLRKDGSLIDESITELAPLVDCKDEIRLANHIFTGINTNDLQGLGVLNSNGQIADKLGYIKMVPYTYRVPDTYFDILAYDNTAVTKSGVPLVDTSRKPPPSLPCPPCPNCKEPCPPPDGCVSPCSTVVIVDSLH